MRTCDGPGYSFPRYLARLFADHDRVVYVQPGEAGLYTTFRGYMGPYCVTLPKPAPPPAPAIPEPRPAVEQAPPGTEPRPRP
jgi:hypothetical protein